MDRREEGRRMESRTLRKPFRAVKAKCNEVKAKFTEKFRHWRSSAFKNDRRDEVEATNHDKLRATVSFSSDADTDSLTFSKKDTDSPCTVLDRVHTRRSFDHQEQFGGVQANNSSEAGENCRPSFDLHSASSSRPPLPLSGIPCSEWKKGIHLGNGSSAKVFRGYISEHGPFCAIKEVTIDCDPQSEKQVIQEIDFVKQWSHPNIVQYYGSIRNDGVLLIFMEYVSKGSIRKLLVDPKIGAFEESLIRNYTAQILSGLAFLHEKKYIHRDIKGANILVGPNNEVKLADFGLTKHIGTLTGVHGSNVGTPSFMAPEVILSKFSGEGYNLSADIWSLGCTVIEMATGKPPLHGYLPIQAIFKIANDKTYIPEIPDVLSDEGKDFVKLCLQRDRRARPSAAQLMDHPFIRNQGS